MYSRDAPKNPKNSRLVDEMFSVRFVIVKFKTKFLRLSGLREQMRKVNKSIDQCDNGWIINCAVLMPCSFHTSVFDRLWNAHRTLSTQSKPQSHHIFYYHYRLCGFSRHLINEFWWDSNPALSRGAPEYCIEIVVYCQINKLMRILLLHTNMFVDV